MSLLEQLLGPALRSRNRERRKEAVETLESLAALVSHLRTCCWSATCAGWPASHWRHGAAARRSRVIPRRAPDVWGVVSDPYHLPAGGRSVTRVESVHERKGGSGSQWTKVFETERGQVRPGRLSLPCSRAPEAYGWEQEIPGSPFEKVPALGGHEIELSDADERHADRDRDGAAPARDLPVRRRSDAAGGRRGASSTRRSTRSSDVHGPEREPRGRTHGWPMPRR